jgi:hypothetical protein
MQLTFASQADETSHPPFLLGERQEVLCEARIAPGKGGCLEESKSSQIGLPPFLSKNLFLKMTLSVCFFCDNGGTGS